MKKILAIAIATAFAAPAFAATSNVDIYGAINVSLDHVDNGPSSWNRMVTNNNSFLGFKGSEDLGGGLSAVWQLETNVNFDSNESASNDAGNMYGTRNTFVGLSSKGLGTVVAGTHDTPYKMSMGKLDIFVGTLGDYNGIFGSAGNKANSSLFDLRTGNTIAYLSPNFGGFDVKAAYVMGLEGATTGTNSRSNAYSLSGTYANGPLFATVAYEKHNNVGTTACNKGAVCLGQGTLDRDAWNVGVGYTIGDLKLGAMYESMDGDAGTAVKHNAWGVNAAYKLGAFTLKGSYADAGKIASVASTGASMLALGADYDLSKRTKVQLTWAKMNNDSHGVWGLGQGATVPSGATGADVSGYSLGMRHTF